MRRVRNFFVFVFRCRLGARCDFPVSAFRANRLYFCSHCRQELLGRTFADLRPEPTDDDDWREDLA